MCRLRLARPGRRVLLVGVGDLEVIRRTTVVHLGEDEGEAARAVLYMVLLTLQSQSDGQQVSQVGEAQGQRAAHGRGKGVTGENMLLHLEEQRNEDK